MLQISNLRLRSMNIAMLDVWWEIEPTFESAGDYDIFVQRSESEFSDFQTISASVRNLNHFRDTSVPNYHSFYQRLFYKLKVVNRVTAATALFPAQGGASLDARPDLIAMEMARQHNLVLKEAKGRAVWIFQRRRTGQKCSICFDQVTQRKIKSSCVSCYDTNFAGGFYAPVQVFGHIGPSEETTVHDAQMVQQQQDCVFELGNYPELGEGDIVVEQENLRWKVGNSINKVEKGRAIIWQTTGVSRIAKGDIEYGLPINITDKALSSQEAAPERNLTNPQTLESARLDKALAVFGK